MQTFSSKACELFKFTQWAESVYLAAYSQRNKITFCLLLASLIPVNTQGYALVRGWNCNLIVKLRTKMNPRWPQGCLFTFLLLDFDSPCLIKHQKGFSEAICFCILVCSFSIGFWFVLITQKCSTAFSHHSESQIPFLYYHPNQFLQMLSYIHHLFY